MQLMSQDEDWSIGPVVRWRIDPLVHWSIGLLVYWSIGPLVHWSIGPLVECQMSNVKNQMSNVNKVKLLSKRTSGVSLVIFLFHHLDSECRPCVFHDGCQ